jgi:molecular chaperone DnaK
MSYWLGIDFGTTFTAAAVHRDGEQAVELVPLGENGTPTASVVFVAPDGSLVVGDAAVRRAVTDPDRVVREVKRRIGDQTPVLVSGAPIGAHTLAARFVRWVVDRVAEREGAPPAGIGVTFPASWGPHKRTLLSDALMFAGVGGDDGSVTLVTEPEAAAVAYAHSQHVEPGSAIGVYDLGGGTFDAAIVRQLADGGFELAGRPEGIDSLGGIDFDEAVFEQVRAHLGAAWAGLDFADPMVISAAAALRRECTEAKKALSSDTEVTIPVMLPGVNTHVRMVRSEFEQLIAPAIDATVDALRDAMVSAELTPADLSAVLLVGGSSRIPLVAQRVSAELDLPVTVDSDPKAVVAIGAALAVSPRAAAVTSVASGRTPLALPSAMEPEEEAVPHRSRRRVAYALVALGACVAAMIGLAGFVGTDILPGSDVASGDELAAVPIVGGDGSSRAVPKDAVDPWTGEPYTETTKPGPTRPDAKPSTTSPTKLAPRPTKVKDRGALIDGATPPPAPTTGGGTSAPGDDGTTEAPPPPVVTTTTEDPPPPDTTTEDPPPPVETTTTTEDPPPPDTTTADQPPAVDPPAGDPPAGDPPGASA